MHEPHMDIIREFFRVLAVCHTVVPDGEAAIPSALRMQALKVVRSHFMDHAAIHHLLALQIVRGLLPPE